MNMFDFFRQMLDDLEDVKNLEKEEFVIEKKGVKTTIVGYFNKRGLPVDIRVKSVYEGNEVNRIDQIEKEISEALEREDFLKCAELKKEKELLLQQK